MPVGQLLLDCELIDADQLEAARQHCKTVGGTLFDAVVALGFVAAEELEAFLGQAPRPPATMADTGLEAQFLLDFVLRTMYVHSLETPPRIGEHIALGERVVEAVLDIAKEKRLVQVMGLADVARSIYRYQLTEAGRDWAIAALAQCQYTGPVPVPLDVYRAQVYKQSIARERITPRDLERALSHLVLPPGTHERLGPAANSGKALLLYGAPGNGKTSIAEGIGGAFSQAVFIPHAIEFGGQVICIFDAAVHRPWPDEALPEDALDPRWVRCHRPVVVTGGELTIEMLDLSFDPISKYYEAPAHVKATGGVFIIDDFGRQRVPSIDLLNRWIMPLDRRRDYLTLHTGRKLELPFDELVVFSTNFPPRELMDDAGLRRIPYKLTCPSPTREEYAQILERLCEAQRLPLGEGVLDYLFERFYPETGLPVSGAHPRAIVAHVQEHSRFTGVRPELSLDAVHAAVQNLLVDGVAPDPHA